MFLSRGLEHRRYCLLRRRKGEDLEESMVSGRWGGGYTAVESMEGMRYEKVLQA